jgi:hypothetical protein
VLAAFLPAVAAAQQRVAFISIKQGTETADADDELRSKLEEKLRGVRLTASAEEYGEAIRKLAAWNEDRSGQAYVARVTPYVYVAAEMLGADFEILGTYVSRLRGGSATYRAHFVVNRAAIHACLGEHAGPPDLADLVAFLGARGNRRCACTDANRECGPARFVYHDRFSTSSYFLPALFFRRHGIFSMTESTQTLVAIASQALPKERARAAELVEEVADGGADFAAVWDHTKAAFQQTANGQQVYFIQLETVLPNDLLVCPRSLRDADDEGRALRARLRELFPEVGTAPPIEIGKGDFSHWTSYRADTRKALEGLRALAAEQRRPLTVNIASAAGAAAVPESYLRAARSAVRLSGGEFVAYEYGYHRAEDYAWTLGKVRHGHVTLRSEIPAFDLVQEIPISFQPARSGEEVELSARLANVLASRLHRIRHVWPYQDDQPLVIRDVPLALEWEPTVLVQKITWSDPLQNGYANGTRGSVTAKPDLCKFSLDAQQFGDAMGGVALDPMSPVAYRVVLLRDEEPRWMFVAFDVGFVLFLALAVGATVVAVWRTRRLRPRDAVAPPVLAPGPATT